MKPTNTATPTKPKGETLVFAGMAKTSPLTKQGGALFFLGVDLYTAPPIFFTREALFKPP